MSTEGLTPRAASLLRTLVGMHIREGQPVGSKALHVESGMSVSTATIRNVMSDLEERGLLSSPHTSAGRIPTAQGYRLFVDSLLQTSPIDASALQALKHELNPNRTSSDLIASASNLLTQVTAQAGIVTVPRPTASQLRQIEFLPLSDSRVLVILVVNEREVQNRVIELSRPLSEEQLKPNSWWIFGNVPIWDWLLIICGVASAYYVGITWYEIDFEFLGVSAPEKPSSPNSRWPR